AMISDHLAYLGIAKEWFDITDLKAILDRRIGRGKIGGKAAGVMLAQCVLRKSAAPELLERIHIPRSWFLGADLFYQFNQLNGLHVFANQKYKPEDEIRADYPEIVRSFQEGHFPEDILERLQGLLDRAGDIPLIVRSSSLLEDSFGTSFAGKYESYFCPNQGSPEENLTQLRDAIKKVYASVYNPDVILYRRKVELLDYDERMAVLIQATQGRRVGAYFLPDAAGVAFSRNQFRWSPRIDRDAGFLRMVWGLGTRAVDQVGSDYPRLVALSHPDLRPENSPREIHRYSQSEVDLIDLDRNAFRSLPVSNCIGPQTPYLRYIAQLYEQGDLQDLLSVPLGPAQRDLVITFDGLLRRTDFPDVMRQMLETLEHAYSSPVDTEFALILEDESSIPQARISLLQCRPQSHLQSERVELPIDINADWEIFRTRLMVPDGIVKHIRYLIYVVPHSYRELQPIAKKHELARLIGRLNAKLADEIFILLGPGRWGSRNPDIGIPVTFADIYHARALIEIADQEHKAEPSYGTHFFQDLVEANIFPLALPLEDPRVTFQRDYFERSRNALINLLPDAAEWEASIHVIDVPQESEGNLVELVMDGDAGEALAYLKPPAR
ncbi:MAG: PEP/pyruvate-binding domain-containing protein, partial [Anaerolineales bacterium]